ncbi:pyruvate dehydrogenase E1 component [Mycobacteroides abscessus subsp. abscessus]|nr:pyruvate dehydrogenase E1 component [Mycobacteroides abscessus subsp. abscessus]
METAVKTSTMTLVQAVNEALDIMLAENDEVLVLGEDIGKNGGVFRANRDGRQWIQACGGNPVSWLYLSCL